MLTSSQLTYWKMVFDCKSNFQNLHCNAKPMVLRPRLSLKKPFSVKKIYSILTWLQFIEKWCLLADSIIKIHTTAQLRWSDHVWVRKSHFQLKQFLRYWHGYHKFIEKCLVADSLMKIYTTAQLRWRVRDRKNHSQWKQFLRYWHGYHKFIEKCCLVALSMMKV